MSSFTVSTEDEKLVSVGAVLELTVILLLFPVILSSPVATRLNVSSAPWVKVSPEKVATPAFATTLLFVKLPIPVPFSDIVTI